MLRTRLVTLLFGCLLLASASWANNLGYVDCAKYPGNTQVLDKAGMTSGAVAFIPCGERFTILVRGEFFTQIQTKDGKVGYLNTYMVTPDTTAATQQQSKPSQTSAFATTNLAQLSAADKFKIISTTPSTPAVAAQASASPAQASNVPAAPTAAAAQPPPSAPAQAEAPASVSASSAPAAQPQLAAPAQPASASSAAAPTAPVTEAKAIAPSQVEVQPSASASSAPVEQPQPSAPAVETTPTALNVQPQTTASSQPAPVASAPAPTPAAAQPEATAPAPVEAPPSAPTTSTPATQPTPSAPGAQPQPEPIQPTVEAPQVRPARPPRNPSPFPNVSNVPMMELFAGYGFTRFGGGNGTNLNGALGSFGWNFKPWLQIIGDASYNFVTVSGTKSVLYGNHFGPRIYLRSRSARGPIPFVEGLVGGSRVDTTTAGVTTSKNGLTYKAGGGIDLAISRHISVRAIEADYYRVPFLTASQTNYVASAGIIFRFGGRPRY